MPRLRPAVAVAAALFVTHAVAADPVNHALAAQTALAEARDLLTANKPADAVAALEKHLADAAGNRAYLDLLRTAYAAEGKKLQLANGDPKRVAELKTKLALLGAGGAGPGGPGTGEEPKPAAAAVVAGLLKAAGSVSTPAPSPPATPIVDKGLLVLQEAADLFNQGKNEPKKLSMASRLFAAAFADKIELNKDQQAAWAYCRIRVAADRLCRPDVTGPAAAAVADEVEDALKLAPANAGLQKVGRELMAAALVKAEQTASGRKAESAVAQTDAASPLLDDDWEVVESPSFRVRHRGAKLLAESVADTAEAKRSDIFARWSGPPGGAWGPKCDIFLHADAAGLAEATKQPKGATGCAAVRLEGGKPTGRRIDLRADDEAAVEVSLPRELTHVVLADLFPNQAPPRWAEEGMAVLASAPAEVDRYLRTAARCRRDGELVPVATLLALTAPPADKVTGFYVGSVSLVEFLVRYKGEKAFTTFLRDGQRYGVPAALKRQYGVADARQLEEMLVRGAAAARGQLE